MFCLQLCSQIAWMSSKEQFALFANSTLLSWEFILGIKKLKCLVESFYIKQSEIILEEEQRNVWNAKSRGVILK